ncbi:TPA: ATP-binding protein [Clostridioides difficile]|uniref:sensor histidine kinase n=1 Tax=Clostridioides difficile TaxID=1496 RepID=UPI00097FDECB|nr:ATP-binding protein [Clostridioides difficile]EGT3816521.1 ATP-binding protein [Clostridioides difficile]EGT3828116.1 ATP-binding protein [Clostridioides difficile]EGT4891400.1 ATP-binding protein [Clostridioides difficile]EKS6800876.1 ATP-binding protein [Clostridioides difficile]EKS7168364.1 ATP-binding protein [Clostridioides difficile]
MTNFNLKILFLGNYILSLLFMGISTSTETYMNIQSIIPLIISTLLLIDITYITSCNVRENNIISLFCGLLALDSWYLLLSFVTTPIGTIIFKILSTVIVYVSIKFIFLFLFQGSGYNFRKITDILLLITCIGAIVGAFISNRTYACMYGIQFVVSIISFFYIIFYHLKRVVFVIKSEKKPISISVFITIIGFLTYYFFTLRISNHIGNFGIYLTVLVFFISILVISLVVLFANGNFSIILIAINVLFMLIFLCNIILEFNLRDEKNKVVKNSKYTFALEKLQQEEQLKTEFSNFLHDDILQNLLSIKNMMSKSYRPDVQDIIYETLNNLNTCIRKQMQDYHPVILKNLTVKENYQNLIESVSSSFPQKNICVSFKCSDTLFLVEPYDILIYRLIKELLTNVYKHSNGSHAWIALALEKNIIKLNISDNGVANTSFKTPLDITKITFDTTKHKGIISIKEQVENLGGTISVSDNIPHGVCVQITIPMKGDGSYKYFVS